MHMMSMYRHHHSSSGRNVCRTMPTMHANAAPSPNATPVSVMASLARHADGDHSSKWLSDTGTMDPTPMPVKKREMAKVHTSGATADKKPKTQKTTVMPMMH